MKKFLLFFLLIPVLLCSCKDDSLKDSAIIRRLRLRNNPEAVAQDFLKAYQTGRMENLLVLSLPRIQDKFYNELQLSASEPGKSPEELLKEYSGKLGEKFRDIQLAAVRITPEPEPETEETPLYIEYHIRNAEEQQENVTYFILRLAKDEYGTWKNTTRL